MRARNLVSPGPGFCDEPSWCLPAEHARQPGSSAGARRGGRDGWPRRAHPLDAWLRSGYKMRHAAGAGGRTAESTARHPATWHCACRSTWTATWTSCWCALLCVWRPSGDCTGRGLKGPVSPGRNFSRSQFVTLREPRPRWGTGCRCCLLKHLAQTQKRAAGTFGMPRHGMVWAVTGSS